MISLKGIEKIYKNGSIEYPVLKNVSLEIGQGEFVIIMGKSGSGKSTLLNILTGVDKPTKGEVVIDKTNIGNYDEGKIAEWRGGNLGIIFQFFQLIPTLSVLENILLPMDLVKKIPSKDRMSRAMQLLKKVGLVDHAYKMPSALSGGEQQRVAIARALANDVQLIVADEPTGNLDSKNAEIIFELFNKLKKEGKTVIMVTHEREMIKGAGRKILLKDGEIVEDTLVEKEAKVG
ncbi:MAG: ABC transporter ATP-binding protein [Clostridia bacterium]|nr:ABC transporter ATP-binding protein [Clostridia bacterium]